MKKIAVIKIIVFSCLALVLCFVLGFAIKGTTVNSLASSYGSYRYADSNLYEALNLNEEKIFDDLNHPQVLDDLLFNNGCNTDDLINESDYFVNKMIKIIKELRKEGYITDDTAVILSDLEISDNTLEIAKKMNKKETIKGFFEEFKMLSDR